MDELERPELVIPKDILVKVGIGAVCIGLAVVVGKLLYDKFGKEDTDESVDILDGPDVLEGKTVYIGGQKLTGIMPKPENDETHKVVMGLGKPPLEKMAYEKIAAAYMEEQPGQERFGVPFEEKEEEVEMEPEEKPADDGIDNGRFDHGPGVKKPEGYETRVGTYFVVDGILAGFNDDLFDVNAPDYIGEEATAVLSDMNRRSDSAYYVVDRDRELWYEILINRLDSYEEGYIEWINDGRRKIS
jgi:hypothetical protein